MIIITDRLFQFVVVHLTSVTWFIFLFQSFINTRLIFCFYLTLTISILSFYGSFFFSHTYAGSVTGISSEVLGCNDDGGKGMMQRIMEVFEVMRDFWFFRY